MFLVAVTRSEKDELFHFMQNTIFTFFTLELAGNWYEQYFKGKQFLKIFKINSTYLFDRLEMIFF
ncbi:MAG: hypothetical protein L0L78_07775 [Tetragenococcus koreensis]|nr:hypothetical protein [Tetragenococcus koreensis]